MFERMRKKNHLLGLPIILLFAVLAGMLISKLVLSLSPLAGFAVIFGVSALIIVVIELNAYFRRRPRGPRRHLLALYLEERKRRGRSKSPGDETVESDAELVDSPELIDSYQHGWVQ